MNTWETALWALASMSIIYLCIAWYLGWKDSLLKDSFIKIKTLIHDFMSDPGYYIVFYISVSFILILIINFLYSLIHF
jgi:hypothetical protein